MRVLPLKNVFLFSVFKLIEFMIDYANYNDLNLL